MTVPHSGELIRTIREQAHWLAGGADDYDPLLERIAEKPIVLIGSATQGSQEFFRARAELTRRLIETRGFTTVLLEADFPSVSKVDDAVRGVLRERADAVDAALGSFDRFPRWMWRNPEFRSFLEWLQRRNASSPENPVHLYGLDLFSLHESVREVLSYLREAAPSELASAEERYECFRSVSSDPARYGHAVSVGTRPACEKEAADQLDRLMALPPAPDARDPEAVEKRFRALMNAHVVRSAERYYRSLYLENVNTWNLRDRHMLETLTAVEDFRTRVDGSPPKIIVWAHNAHVGDARATQWSEGGEWSLGQLLRERFGAGMVHSIGFTTYAGMVTAAMAWGGRAERMVLQPAQPESVEGIFHRTGLGRFALDLGNPVIREALSEARTTRSVGLIYRPRNELQAHYFKCLLPEQFDSVMHFDITRPLEPLDESPTYRFSPGRSPDNANP